MKKMQIQRKRKRVWNQTRPADNFHRPFLTRYPSAFHPTKIIHFQPAATHIQKALDQLPWLGRLREEE
jgi:hypothetical protein